MQRAAAANPEPPSTPSNERASKRQRLSTGDAVASRSPATPASANATPANQPQTEEEKKRQSLLDRKAEQMGETKWVLSVQEQAHEAQHSPFRIVTAGYGAIDHGVPAANATPTDYDTPAADDDNNADDDDAPAAFALKPSLQGRRSFGKFNKSLEVRMLLCIPLHPLHGCLPLLTIYCSLQKQHNPDLSSSSSESEDAHGHGDDASNSSASDSDDDSTQARSKQQRKEVADSIRKERKAKKKADQADLDKLARERRKKDLNLNKATRGPGARGGISSGGQGAISSGGRGARSSSSLADMTCNECGQNGHLMRDCPQTRQKRRDRYSGASALQY